MKLKCSSSVDHLGDCANPGVQLVDRDHLQKQHLKRLLLNEIFHSLQSCKLTFLVADGRIPISVAGDEVETKGAPPSIWAMRLM